MFSVEIEIGGKKLSIASGKIAKQADGAVTVRYGDTVILATVVAADTLPENIDMLPLTVDYREKISAVGKIPGGYIKREGRPTEKEILTARLIDRPIRPLFPEGFYNEVQIMVSVLSADGENDPDTLSIVGASAALMVSDIPFPKPIGAVRIGMIDNELILNPTIAQLETSKLDIVVAGTFDGVVMVEGKASEISEETLISAIYFAHTEIKKIIELQSHLQELCGKIKREVQLITLNEEIYRKVKDYVAPKIFDVITIPQKLKRQDALKELYKETAKQILAETDQFTEFEIKQAFQKIEKNTVREIILDKGLRCDGRSPVDIRSISCEVGFLPRTHGSALFTRGETQSLVITTLGSSGDAQKLEGLAGEMAKTFMLHYNFPPFSVGECRPVRGPGRREIGHGILAERALQAVMPNPKDFPYIVRVVSDILESNGSSSMASVCGGTLSLMDAGVPIKSPVAGIAMGLIVEGDRVVVLSDILGSEDSAGDMDFKVAGTKEGITAFQMDLKVESITGKIMEQALYQAKEGRLKILDIMLQTLSAPRESLSEYAPRIITIQIDPDKIGTVIGPGGKVIKKIIEETKVTIDIDDSGLVYIASTDKNAADEAIRQIKRLTAEVELGQIYDGVVRSVTDFGAFVEVLPGKDGMIHVSRLSEQRVRKASDVISIGDKVTVRVAEIDERGRINLELIVDGKPVGRTERREKRPHHDTDRGSRS